MTSSGARTWLVTASLIMAALAFAFFLLAPVFGYPLRFSQSLHILQIIFPAFLGYLGLAAQFLFNKKSTKSEIQPDAVALLALLVKGPIFVFFAMLLVSIIAFGYSNRNDALPGDGMSVDMLATAVTAAMGLLAVTTNTVVAYLFSVEKRSR